MKKLLLLFVLISTLSFGQHFQDTWEFRADKKLHTFAGLTLSVIPSSACYYHTQDFKNSMLIGVAVGGGANLIKEVYDYTTNRGTASYHDLAYGFGGAVVGSLIGIGYASFVKWHEKKQENKRLML